MPSVAALPWPMLPPPPGWFTTSTCWPSLGARCCAITRESRSGLVPGAAGVMMRSALDGYASWAQAPAPQEAWTRRRSVRGA